MPKNYDTITILTVDDGSGDVHTSLHTSPEAALDAVRLNYFDDEDLIRLDEEYGNDIRTYAEREQGLSIGIEAQALPDEDEDAEELPGRRPSRNDAAWLDFEPEPDTTGDGEGDPDKHILTIAVGFGTTTWPDEVAVIVHRTCGGKYPIDGELANEKRRNAQIIVDALNAPDVPALS